MRVLQKENASVSIADHLHHLDSIQEFCKPLISTGISLKSSATGRLFFCIAKWRELILSRHTVTAHKILAHCILAYSSLFCPRGFMCRELLLRVHRRQERSFADVAKAAPYLCTLPRVSPYKTSDIHNNNLPVCSTCVVFISVTVTGVVKIVNISVLFHVAGG
jgi:hypothetical protein